MTTPIRRVSRRMPGWAKAVTAVVLVLVVFFAGIRLSLLPGLKDLFGTQTHDRSGPALLQSIQDMSRYDAASGNFQVVVDLEKDAKFLPSAVRGSRTLFVGNGDQGVSSLVGQGGKQRFGGQLVAGQIGTGEQPVQQAAREDRYGEERCRT